MKNFYPFLIGISWLAAAVISVLPYSSFPITNQPLYFGIEITVLLLYFAAARTLCSKQDSQQFVYVRLLLVWNIVCVIRGAFAAENYWDWKALLTNSLGIMLPIIAYSSSNIRATQKALFIYLKMGVPIFLFMLPFIEISDFGFLFIPVSFLLVFAPAMSIPRGILNVGMGFIFVILDLSVRSNFLKLLFAISVVPLYYLRIFAVNTLLEISRKILFLLPFILISLGILGIFNPFKMDEYLKGNYEFRKEENGKRVDEDLKADTRTFLYMEVLSSALYYDSWIFGRTPARGNLSSAFGHLDMAGRGERYANEVGMLNVFTWTGIVGVILTFLVMYRASFLAVNFSNNYFAKMLGIYVAFRWMYGWVEDVNNFTINYIFIWVVIGLAMSHQFRNLKDNEVREWVFGIYRSRLSFWGFKRKAL